MSSHHFFTRRALLKGLTAMPVLAALTDSESAFAQDDKPVAFASKLPHSSPESLGIDSAGIAGFVEAVNAKVGGLHSFILMRHGKVAAEGWWLPYAPHFPHMLYSLSKSFTSSAVGFAVAEGKFTVDSLVTSFFPDELPAKMDENLAKMQVKHLLTMATGHDQDATARTRDAKDGNWVRAFLSLPVEHAPGSKFVYNSAATYLLSAIVQKVTGKTVQDYLTPRLFQPLGITGATWETCPKGINVGGWGLSIKTEDIARFGQTYLQKGKWNGEQVVPAAWVEEATTKHIANGDPKNPSDWSQGYGYQFWRCQHGHYRGDGAFGQYCVVMPEHDAVLAITSGVGDMQAVLTAAWDHLLPAMKTEPITAKPMLDLKKTLEKLAVPVIAGKPSSPMAERISGKTFTFEKNDAKIETLTLTFTGQRGTLKLTDARGEHTATFRMEDWARGSTTLVDMMDKNSAIRGTWTTDDTLALQICFYKTPYIQTFLCRFEGNTLALTRKLNVSFGPNTTLPTLMGHLGA